MLFHVTATHSQDDCPMYNADERPAFEEATSKMGDLARELGVKVHFTVSGAPDHVMYMLLEDDDFAAIQRLLASIPLRQEFTITPVVDLGEATKTLLQ